METIQRKRKFNPGKKKRFARIQLSKQEWSRKSHGWRGLVGCSPWCWEESDTTEQLNFHFSLWWIGEANGNPLQCSCLENPRDGGACGLPSMGSHRVGHDWSDLAAAAPQQKQLGGRSPPDLKSITCYNWGRNHSARRSPILTAEDKDPVRVPGYERERDLLVLTLKREPHCCAPPGSSE